MTKPRFYPNLLKAVASVLLCPQLGDLAALCRNDALNACERRLNYAGPERSYCMALVRNAPGTLANADEMTHYHADALRRFANGNLDVYGSIASSTPGVLAHICTTLEKQNPEPKPGAESSDVDADEG